MVGYTDGMTRRLGPKGQVVIPKEMRAALGLKPGDEVAFRLAEDGVVLQRARPSTSLRGSFAGLNLLEVLEAEHRAELR